MMKWSEPKSCGQTNTSSTFKWFQDDRLIVHMEGRIPAYQPGDITLREAALEFAKLNFEFEGQEYDKQHWILVREEGSDEVSPMLKNIRFKTAPQAAWDSRKRIAARAKKIYDDAAAFWPERAESELQYARIKREQKASAKTEPDRVPVEMTIEGGVIEIKKA